MNTEQLKQAAPMTSREAFEAHFLKLTGERPHLIQGAYNSMPRRCDWATWQAAIEWASKRAQEACDNMDCAHRCQVGHEFKTAIKEALK